MPSYIFCHLVYFLKWYMFLFPVLILNLKYYIQWSLYLTTIWKKFSELDQNILGHISAGFHCLDRRKIWGTRITRTFEFCATVTYCDLKSGTSIFYMIKYYGLEEKNCPPTWTLFLYRYMIYIFLVQEKKITSGVEAGEAETTTMGRK